MTGTNTMDRVMRALWERNRQITKGNPSTDSVQLGEKIAALFDENLSKTAASERRAQLDDSVSIEADADKLEKALACVGADEDQHVLRLAEAILARIPTNSSVSIRQVNKNNLQFGNNVTITGSFNQNATTGGSVPGKKS